MKFHVKQSTYGTVGMVDLHERAKVRSYMFLLDS